MCNSLVPLLLSQEAQEKRLKQLELQNENLQEDLRAVYRKHKKELTDLETTYRHADYEARYAALVAENAALQQRVESLQAAVQRVTAVAEQQTQLAQTASQAWEVIEARCAQASKMEADFAAEREALEDFKAAAQEEVEAALQGKREAEALYEELRKDFDAIQQELNEVLLNRDELGFQLEEARMAAAAVAAKEQAIAVLQAAVKSRDEYIASQFVRNITVSAVEDVHVQQMQQLRAEMQAAVDAKTKEMETYMAQQSQVDSQSEQLLAKLSAAEQARDHIAGVSLQWSNEACTEEKGEGEEEVARALGWMATENRVGVDQKVGF